MSDKCSACSAPIFWAVTPNGSRMPVNAEPDPDGNVIVMQSRTNPDDKKAVVLAHDAEKPADRRLFTSHFSNCPKAGQFRKKRAKP